MKTRVLVILLAAASMILMSQPTPREEVGFLPDGSFLLSSGWRIHPIGSMIPVETFPMASLITPDKKSLLVLNGGYNPPTISVIDIAAGKELSRVPVPDAWLGLTMTKAGDKVYVGGGSRAAVYEFSLKGSVLAPARVFPVVAEKDRKPEDFIGDVQFAPDGHLLYAADLFHDSVVVINPQSGVVISRIKTGRRPYRILFHPSGKSFYVSSWADGSIGRYDAANGERISLTRVAPHTTDMVWRTGEVDEQPEVKARIFVSASNTNSVYVLGANESGDLTQLENINLSLTPRQPLGMTPSGLGVSADGKKLFVACADANTAAIVDITGARSRVQGFVPTGWYPTSAFGMPDGRMAVLNGKGLRSYANPGGPNPTKRAEILHEGAKRSDQYVGSIQTGTIQLIDISDESKFESYTAAVLANSPYRDEKLDDAEIPEGNPVRPGGPIKHVLYIVKENRTYDQVLGDMKEGNGDAALTIFGEKVTPNLHKLAREFALLDNFYENSDVSADGHNWATAAIAPDYTQRMWPNSYAARRKKYDYEGQEPANQPPAGYIWTAAQQAGVSMRNYGYFVDLRKEADADGTQITAVRDPILAPITDPNYRGFDLNYPDIERAKEFLSELADFEKAGSMPQFMIMRMGNDHTNGAAAGKLGPLSLAADNDQGIGMIAEGLSKSRFWNETAIFVIEDDAQNGPDHVDSHRSPCWVISPWVKRGVNSVMYNQASVLRTMEIILGLHPMTTYDAGARPMFGVFGNAVAPAKYVLEQAQTPLDIKNPANTVLARRSAKMDFDEADEIDDDELNAILWAAIKGPGVPMPSPMASRFSH